MQTNRNRNRTAAMRGLSAAGCVAALSLAASCDSFINPDPNDVLAPETFYRTSSDAVAAVNGVYEQTKWAHWLGYWYMSDIATDDIIATANFGSDGHRMADYTFDANEWPLGDYWGGRYTIISRANAVLERVPPIVMDTTLRNRLLGEAQYLRALAYFELVRAFGDVPLIEHELRSLGELHVSRTPQAQVYALIESDLQQAITRLPPKSAYSTDDKGRASKGAAQALLAKVYLNEQKYTEAAAMAAQVIASGEYALLDNYKDNFKIATEIVNSESIFEINYDGTLDPGSGAVMNLFSLPGGYPGGDAYGLMQLPPSLKALFAANDERGEHATFMTPPYTDAEGRVVTWDLPPNSASAFDKYLDETNQQNMHSRGWAQQSNNWIIQRYADVLLIYAEAVNEGGTAGSMTKETALNMVRQRANLPAVSGLSAAAFRDSLRVERRREFVFEGQRWFDLSRWNLLATVFQAKKAEMATIYPGEDVHIPPSNLFPIPQSEININPSLTQNPGW